MEFEVGEYKTRDGTPAKVLAVMPEPRMTGEEIIGCIKIRDAWEVCWWNTEGRFMSDRDDGLDLMPEPMECWLVVTVNGGIVQAYSNREIAEQYCETYPCYRVIHMQEVRQ